MEKLAPDICQHDELETLAEVNKMPPQEGGGISTHEISIKVRCARCETQFHFVGVDQGASYRRPMAGAMGTELLVPVAPGSGPMTFQTFETAPENFASMMAEEAAKEPGVIPQAEATETLPPAEVSDAEYERRAAEELTRDEPGRNQ